MRVKSLIILAAILCACACPTDAFCARNKGVPLDYVGHRSYPMFTRLVFDTGPASPEDLKIGYDEVGRKVVFGLSSGSFSFSFKPVSGIDKTVTAIDYIQVEPGRLGVVIRLGRNALGFRVSYLYNPNRLVLDIYRQSQFKPFMPVNRPIDTIALDPGHGGTSLGYVGDDGLAEADVVYKLAQKLKASLEARGFKVVLTRNAETAPDPVEREGIANSDGADMYISLHATGGPSPAGAAVYTDFDGVQGGGGNGNVPMLWSEQNAVYLPECTRLAGKLADYLKAISGVEPPVRDLPIYGMDGLSMPAVMVELGGLGGGGRGARLADDEYLDRLAGMLANGIISYAGGKGP